jgi:hypothetical protein
MKATTIFVMTAMTLLTSAAAAAPNGSTPDDATLHDACWDPEGPCTKLDQAIAAGFGLLNNPFADAKNDDHSKRAEDYLTSALKAASARDVRSMTKRSPMPDPGRGWWCRWVGEGCYKVRRSAAAIQDILGDASLQKRWASPRRGWWCMWVGEGCYKARRSIDHLLTVSGEVLKALPVQGEISE